jgi:hypothetical protein
MKAILAITVSLLAIAVAQQPACFTTKYPVVLGGNMGNTVFTVFDIDSSFDIVAGGETEASDLAT